MSSALLLLSVLHKWQVVFSVVLYFVVHNFVVPNHICTQLFLGTYSFFVLLLEELFIHEQALQQRGPGPRSQLLLVAQGENLIPCVFQLLEAGPHLLACVPTILSSSSFFFFWF